MAFKVAAMQNKWISLPMPAKNIWHSSCLYIQNHKQGGAGENKVYATAKHIIKAAVALLRTNRKKSKASRKRTNPHPGNDEEDASQRKIANRPCCGSCYMHEVMPNTNGQCDHLLDVVAWRWSRKIWISVAEGSTETTRKGVFLSMPSGSFWRDFGSGR